jgi:hypothetical protein
MTSGFVYIVEGAGLFKIGATRRGAVSRLMALQVGSPVLLALKAQIPSNTRRPGQWRLPNFYFHQDLNR